MSDFDSWFAAMNQVTNDFYGQGLTDTINITSSFTAPEQVILNGSVIINGQGNTIDMQGSDRAIFIAGGGVTINSLNIANGNAVGGLGVVGGGGGAGLGGAIFVGSGTVCHGKWKSGDLGQCAGGRPATTFSGNKAVGGAAQLVSNEVSPAGGGGMGGGGGNSGTSGSTPGAGGGGFGNGSTGGSSVDTGVNGADGGFINVEGDTAAGGGSDSGAGIGGLFGGGGGNGGGGLVTLGSGGGGGVGGQGAQSDSTGGNGGFGGGGGAIAGNGGFGGGGGAGGGGNGTGGAGGFGGGGGSADKRGRGWIWRGARSQYDGLRRRRWRPRCGRRDLCHERRHADDYRDHQFFRQFGAGRRRIL